MKRRGQLVRLLLFVFAGFCVHAAFANVLGIRGVSPNLSVVSLLLGSLFAGPNTGAVLGFAAGLFEGAYASRTLGSFIVARSLAGFAVGALDKHVFRDSPWVACATVFLGSLGTEACFFLFVPDPHALRWATYTLWAAVYNASLALPLYFVVRVWVRGR